jgi:CheY-like chemotaxis protein
MPKLACVLLVDDDPIATFLHRRLLARLALTDTLVEAHDGQQALDQVMVHCQRARPDCPALILLDLHLPVVGGLEFLDRYARLPLAHVQPAIIIVLLTACEHPQRVQGLGLGGLLHKPLTREKLDAVLQAYFDHPLSPA